ncbi:MAG: hypothetical protein LBH82_00805 [Bacteroidales bacterium]|jgi:hypothetical protein|nr:hypothetical protein [Bacteroidales bacterium]
MMQINKNTPLVYLSITFLLLGACEKDFSVNSENVEPFPVVYALLNASEDVHYIKVYKSFLVEGNAYDLVNNINNYSYLDSVDVYVVEYDENGNKKRTINFSPTWEVPKDSGLFEYPAQMLYKAETKLNADYSYQLFVDNRYTKIRVYNETPVFPAGKPTAPRMTSKPTITIPNGVMEWEFLTSSNTTKYLLRLYFYYTEVLTDNTRRQPEPVLWTIGTVSDHLLTANREKNVTISAGSAFFQKIAYQIRKDPNVSRRYVDSLVYEIYAAASDWDLYIQSTQPPTGLNQNKLYYSNLKACHVETKQEMPVVGFFSFRNRMEKQYEDLHQNTKDSLRYGRYTKDLLFY